MLCYSYDFVSFQTRRYQKNGDLHRKLFETIEIPILIYPGEEHFFLFFFRKEEQLKHDKQDSEPSPSKLTYDALLTN